jgi:hypothetical protein
VRKERDRASSVIATPAHSSHGLTSSAPSSQSAGCPEAQMYESTLECLRVYDATVVYGQKQCSNLRSTLSETVSSQETDASRMLVASSSSSSVEDGRGYADCVGFAGR